MFKRYYLAIGFKTTNSSTVIMKCNSTMKLDIYKESGIYQLTCPEYN